MCDIGELFQEAAELHPDFYVLQPCDVVCLESPDLAITEAAVGAGVTSVLFFVTLKKIHAIDESGTKGEKESMIERRRR